MTKDFTPTFPIGLSLGQIQYGWNAKTWEPVGVGSEELLACTFGEFVNGKPAPEGTMPRTVSLPQMKMPTACTVPDGADIIPLSVGNSVSKSVFQYQQSHIRTALDASIAESIGVPGLFSESASLSVRTKTVLDTSSESRVVERYASRVLFEFSWHDWSTSVTDAFKEDAQRLLQSDGAPDLDQFFTRWGTHFLTRGCFGGIWVSRLTVSASEIGTEYASSLEESIDESGLDEEITESAKAKIATAFEKKTNVRLKSIETSHYCIGGEDGSSDYRTWDSNVNSQPSLLTGAGAMASESTRPSFTPISELLVDAQDKAKLLGFIKTWLGCVPEATVPTVDARVLIPRQRYTDHGGSDRLITGLVACGPAVDNTTTRCNAVVTLGLDGSGGAIAGAAADVTHWNSNKNVFQYASFLAPVLSGADIYVQQSVNDGTCAERLIEYAVPSLFAGTHEFAGSGQLDTDALLVACIRSDTDGTGGAVKCTVTTPGAPGTMDFSAQIKNVFDSNIKVGVASICLPLAQGTRVEVETGGSVTCTRRIYPINAGRFRLASRAVDVGRWANAGAYGTFLSASLAATRQSFFIAALHIYASDVPVADLSGAVGGPLHVGTALISYRESWYHGIFNATASTFIPPGMLYYVDTTGVPADSDNRMSLLACDLVAADS